MTEETKEFCATGKRFSVKRRFIGFNVLRQGLDWAVVDVRGAEICECDDENCAEVIADALSAVALLK